MSLPRRCVLASSNVGKLREFAALLEPLGIELLGQDALGIEAAPEPHITFVENALAKARHASEQSGYAALADDSGICVPALGGAPGVYSARYAALAGAEHSDAANNARLINELGDLSARSSDESVYDAYYYCVLVMVRSADDPQPVIADGRLPGRVRSEPAGDNGFGYDPHFWIASVGKTAAELAPEEKNAISHRAMALRSLVAKLDD